MSDGSGSAPRPDGQYRSKVPHVPGIQFGQSDDKGAVVCRRPSSSFTFREANHDSRVAHDDTPYTFLLVAGRPHTRQHSSRPLTCREHPQDTHKPSTSAVLIQYVAYRLTCSEQCTYHIVQHTSRTTCPSSSHS